MKNMNSFLYQLDHPWHWLTYGQNASAVAAVAAFFGLVGLYLYTRYTRTMMQVQQSTARASIEPLLVTDGSVEFEPTQTRVVEVARGVTQPRNSEYRVVLSVRNIGQGTALYARAWCQSVSDDFAGSGSTILNRTPDAKESGGFAHLQRSDIASITIEKLAPEITSKRRIIVVETIDVTSVPHQLQIIQTPLGPGEVETQVTMVHADPRKYRKYLKKAHTRK